MKKQLFLLLAVAGIAVPAGAQSIVIHRSEGGGINAMSTNDQPQLKTLGEATLECVYDYQFVTNSISGERRTNDDVMILQTGNGISKFYSYRTFLADSMRQGVTPAEMLANIDRYKGGEAWVLFKNYPDGKLTHTDRVGRDWILYEEDAPVIEWEIGDQTKEIEGYTCQKAECDFRGRHWTAWFSPEVPVSEGPWKLGGLPGLIMQAVDGDGDYTFTLTGLRQIDARPVTMAERQYLKSSRENYLKTKRKFAEDPIGMMSQSGINITIQKQDGSGPDPEMMAPRELNYDFLETDYR